MRVLGDNRINFTAGKVNLFSDFDGTYCPSKHSSLHDFTKESYMKDYSNRMNKFFNSTKGDLFFHITSGRTFGEYESISWLLKLRGFKLPFPSTFIAKNGSDEYIKTGNDSDFYEKGIFPFSYSKTSKEKEAEIEKLTNWSGKAIQEKIKNLAQKYNIKIIEGDSENSVYDYGKKSLFSKGKLDPDEWKKLPKEKEKILIHQKPVIDCIIGSRKDGNLKINLVFPSDYGFCIERTCIYDSFINDLKNFLENNQTKYNINWHQATKKNFYRISCNIAPEIQETPLSKLYDTKKAIKEALKNNDMVIVAGNGSNDFEMLNPINYLEKDLIEKCKQNSKYKNFYESSMLKDLEKIYQGDNSEYITGLKEELKANGFLKQLENLPFCGIIIGDGNLKLKSLVDTFKTNGKVILIKPAQLDTGVIQAIKNYSNENKAFYNAMSKNFKKFVFSARYQINKTIKTALLFFVGILTVIAALVYHKKHSN